MTKSRLSFMDQLRAQQKAEAGVNPALPANPEKIRAEIEALKIKRELLMRGKRVDGYSDIGEIDYRIFDLVDQLEALERMESQKAEHERAITEAESQPTPQAYQSDTESKREASVKAGLGCPRCLAERCMCDFSANDHRGKHHHKPFRGDRNGS
jgi:hypothetical protein